MAGGLGTWHVERLHVMALPPSGHVYAHECMMLAWLP